MTGGELLLAIVDTSATVNDILFPRENRKWYLFEQKKRRRRRASVKNKLCWKVISHFIRDKPTVCRRFRQTRRNSVNRFYYAPGSAIIIKRKKKARRYENIRNWWFRVWWRCPILHTHQQAGRQPVSEQSNTGAVYSRSWYELYTINRWVNRV